GPRSEAYKRSTPGRCESSWPHRAATERAPKPRHIGRQSLRRGGPSGRAAPSVASLREARRRLRGARWDREETLRALGSLAKARRGVRSAQDRWGAQKEMSGCRRRAKRSTLFGEERRAR